MQLRTSARETNHRRIAFICGEPSWCRAEAEVVLSSLKVDRALWFTQADEGIQFIKLSFTKLSPPPLIAHQRNYAKYLGNEFDLIIFDAFSGFNPSHVAALSGALVGGGLFIMLCPPFNEWPDYRDPEFNNIVVYPYSAEQLSGKFIRYWLSRIRQRDDMVILNQKGEHDLGINALRFSSLGSATSIKPALYTEQNNAIEKIAKVATGRKRRPLVIKSNRGRGKSAALGRAAALLFKNGNAKKIIVTSGFQEATQILFSHCQAILSPDALLEFEGNTLKWRDCKLIFAPADELLNRMVEADLLMVDEAAAIPTHFLQKLLYRYQRIVFATTTHGYEGTGRGFELRFQPVLNKLMPQWREITLHEPIRWSADDPLEELINTSFILADSAVQSVMSISDAASHFIHKLLDRSEEIVVKSINVEKIEFEKIDRSMMVDDILLLEKIFGLLVSAHYRTSPGDLRNLLEGPNLIIWVARIGVDVCGVIVVAEEGGFDANLAKQILLGNRRPRGHVVPQILIAQLGVEAAAELKCYRIVRIAVESTYQRRGIGAQMMQRLIEESIKTNIDYVSACFGATPELLNFWRSVELLPLRFGSSVEKSSGLHSAVVVKLLSPKSNNILAPLFNRFVEQFPLLISDLFQQVEPELIASLMALGEGKDSIIMDGHDWADVQLFAHANRSYESCIVPLWKLTCSELSKTAMPFAAAATRDLFVECLLQKKTWQELGTLHNLTGKREIVSSLRDGVREILQRVEEL